MEYLTTFNDSIIYALGLAVGIFSLPISSKLGVAIVDYLKTKYKTTAEEIAQYRENLREDLNNLKKELQSTREMRQRFEVDSLEYLRKLNQLEVENGQLKLETEKLKQRVKEGDEALRKTYKRIDQLISQIEQLVTNLEAKQ